MTTPIVLDGNSLTIADLCRVARERVPVALATGAREKVTRVRAIVDDLVKQNRPVYGVTTGFGKMSDISIPPDRQAELQSNLVRSHVCGVGPLMVEEEVRAMMLLRANVLAKGHSGVRGVILDLLLGMLNAGVWPPVPEQGSVGASGDLAPLAHLAITLMGEGELFQGSERGAAGEVLTRHGLTPVVLQPKEGVGLINGTQAHTAVAALALDEAFTLWESANVAGGASLDALLGTPVAFDPRIHEARGQVGQTVAAARLLQLLAGSQIRESHRLGDRRVQDAYALRCMPQVHGPVYDALRHAESVIARELNAATDNPLVFEDGSLLSGGNFHGQAVAMVLDFLAIALTTLAVMSERRIDRLVHPDLSEGLPPFLTRDAGASSGFMMVQVTAAALTSECKVLAHPASVDSIPTDGGKEDVVPMAMGAAIKLRRVLHNVKHVIAIELLCAMQGIDFRRPLRSSASIELAHARVRARVPFRTMDGPFSDAIQSLAAAITRREFVGLT